MRKITAIALASMMAFGTSTAFAAETATAADTAKSVATQTQATKTNSGHGHMNKMRHGGKDGGGMGMHGRMFENLNLTQAQRDQMKALMEQRKDKRDEHHADMEAMHKLVASDTFDEAAARKMADKMSTMQVESMKTRNEMYNLLTPEQKAQYNSNYKQRTEKMQQRMKDMTPAAPAKAN